MVDPTEAEKRRREEAVRDLEAHERDPASLDGETPYDPDTGEAGTTRPRSAAPMGSAGPTGVVPPKAGGASQWRQPALIAGAVLLVLLVLLLLT